jgi:hypothetical protein
LLSGAWKEQNRDMKDGKDSSLKTGGLKPGGPKL